MGIDLDCLEDPELTFSANWWIWRTIVERIEGWNVFSKHRIEMMLCNSFIEISEDDARFIGEMLAEECLPELGPGERLLLGGGKTAEPDDYQFHREDIDKNYSAPRQMLLEFIDFCRRCKGFRVG